MIHIAVAAMVAVKEGVEVKAQSEVLGHAQVERAGRGEDPPEREQRF
jgi:hypothetical protein